MAEGRADDAPVGADAEFFDVAFAVVGLDGIVEESLLWFERGGSMLVWVLLGFVSGTGTLL